MWHFIGHFPSIRFITHAVSWTTNLLLDRMREHNSVYVSITKSATYHAQTIFAFNRIMLAYFSIIKSQFLSAWSNNYKLKLSYRYIQFNIDWYLVFWNEHEKKPWNSSIELASRSLGVRKACYQSLWQTRFLSVFVNPMILCKWDISLDTGLYM